MELFICDISMQGLGVVDVYSYFSWERRFYSAGKIKIKAPCTENNIALLKEGRIICRGDCKDGGIITKITLTTYEICVEGRMLSYLFDKKIVRGFGRISGYAEDAMYNLVNNVMVQDENNRIDNLYLDEKSGFLAEYSGYATYIDLAEMLYYITISSGIGFDILPDMDSKSLTFHCFEGRNVSKEVVFSAEFENLVSAEYAFDRECEVNAVTARYSGSDGAVTATVSPTNAMGTSRREICIEGKGVYRTVNVDGVYETVLDRAATLYLLEATAYKRLCSPKESFSGTTSISQTTVYREDFDIGDIVTIESELPKISAKFRIIAVKEVQTDGKIEVIPEFAAINEREII